LVFMALTLVLCGFVANWRITLQVLPQRIAICLTNNKRESPVNLLGFLFYCIFCSFVWMRFTDITSIVWKSLF
ncbi:MAG: hypothetical protein K2O54_07900, partial [Prevotella sp.]|nr:hypothetical protein [Prevotella sp.]